MVCIYSNTWYHNLHNRSGRRHQHNSRNQCQSSTWVYLNLPNILKIEVRGLYRICIMLWDLIRFWAVCILLGWTCNFADDCCSLSRKLWLSRICYMGRSTVFQLVLKESPRIEPQSISLDIDFVIFSICYYIICKQGAYMICSVLDELQALSRLSSRESISCSLRFWCIFLDRTFW